MEEKNLKLVQKSGSYNYKLVIPIEVERKIRFTCQKVWNTEWSGALFFTYKGSFSTNNLVITCKDIYIMDIGSATYTEFDMNSDVIAYMAENPELLDCQIGLIHSHSTFSTFFSGTDTNTLKEEGRDRNNFVSLIVNNEGTYTAAITRKIVSSKIKEVIDYEFFGEGETNETVEYEDSSTIIEWFYLKIDKESDETSFNSITDRLKEIKKAKEEKAKETKLSTCIYGGCQEVYSNNVLAPTTKVNLPVQGELFPKNESLKSEDDKNYEDFYKYFKVNKSIINSLIKQLITCSLIIPSESKLDINKWAKGMPNLFKKRFGDGDEGLHSFEEWASTYLDFLFWNIEDKELEYDGLSNAEIQAVYAGYVITELQKLPQNEFINIYINVLNDTYIL